MAHNIYTILVIESVRSEANTYEALLTEENGVSYRVLRAPLQTVDLPSFLVIDIILLDASDCDILSNLEQWQGQWGEHCPPIIMIGNNEAKVAVQAMKAGVTDYLIRDDITSHILTQAITSAIAQAQRASKSSQRMQALETHQEDMEIELADAQLLQQISTQLIQEDNLNAFYEQVLDAAIALMGSDMASLQLFDPQENALHLLTQRGLNSASVNVWQWVKLDSNCCCGMAFKAGQRVIIPNIEAVDEILEAEDYPFFKLSEIKAVQSTPLMSRQGHLIGMIATHWQHPHQPSEKKLNLLDVLVRQITDLVEQQEIQTRLRTDLEKTKLLHDLSVKLIREEDTQILYDDLVNAAIKLMKADGGTVQILDQETQKLILLASKGFDATVIDYFYEVEVGSHTSCGVALAEGKRIFFDFDLSNQDDPSGSIQMHINAGYYCAQSTPLITRFGNIIGMVSTHWHQPHHRPTERELYFLDLLARQAADLIEQRQLLEREQAARAEAERNNRIKNEFLSILSHELRSPLNPILTWAQLLQTRQFDAVKTANALATIERSAKVQMQLIDDLLDVARILRGKLKLNLTSVNLPDVIEAAIETVKNAATAKSITLNLELSPVPTFSGDPVRLQQVIWNLLSNAIKFTPQGGRVDVGLEAVEKEAHISVKDTGKGIHPQFLPHIFESFRQQDTSLTRQFGGLGLGLSIARYLLEAHGGTITAESAGVGQGATFTVILPLEKVESDPIPQEKPLNAELDLTGIRVLAVDDEAESRDLFHILLSVYNAEVRTASSGVEALAILPSFQPNLLISDIAMPEMDGYALIKQIRALPAENGGQISAIALTAYAQPEDQQRALESGYHVHLPKPLDIKQLLETMISLTSNFSNQDSTINKERA